MAQSKNSIILKSLRIQNFATIHEQEISFNKGFNVIVGETGSGKSLILDALQLVFGSRADKKFIRKDSDFAVIEATFKCSCPEIKRNLVDSGFPFEEEINVKRVLKANGSSKAFLNFGSCPVSTLVEFSKRYIDLVGQFENQKLLSPNYQLVLLDRYANLTKKAQEFKQLFLSLTELKSKFQENKERLETLIQKEDYLRFQINEIESFDPSVEEEASLIGKKTALLNSSDYQDAIQEVNNTLGEGDQNILSMLSKISHHVSKVSSILPNGLEERFNNLLEDVKDVSYEFSSVSLDEFNPSELEQILDRLDEYQKLKLKFGGSIQSIIDTLSEYQLEISSIEGQRKIVNDLETSLEQSTAIGKKEAQKLSEKRKVASVKLSKDLTKSVQSLNMKGCTLSLNILEQDQLSQNGINQLEFMAETNSGEGFFKIKEIASGGELSRILLSMRKILASTDTVSVFLFDEIDTGIGGETALKIGHTLADISENSQVIAITHLPQLVHYADHIVNVVKETHESRSFSYINYVSPKNKDKYIKETMLPIH